MQDILQYLVLEILPLDEFVLVETIACTCRALAPIAAQFRAAHGIGPDSCDLAGIHPHGVHNIRGKYRETAYGRVICKFKEFPHYQVKSFDLRIERFGQHTVISIWRNGLYVLRHSSYVEGNVASELATDTDYRKLREVLSLDITNHNKFLHDLPRRLWRIR